VRPMSTLKAAVALVALSSLAGCFGAPPETRYFSLRGDNIARRADATTAPAGAPIVLVDRFTIDEAYADERLAYRKGGSNELGFDPYSRWAGAPAAQVEDAVRDLLLASGAFAAVRQAQPLGDGRSTYDLVVTGRVRRLEEVDVNDDEWLGALDIELYLLDGKTRTVLQWVELRDNEKASSRNPREVVAALSRLLAKAVDELVRVSKPVLAGRKPAR
jgi:ABC-type uncharacterized transport system auxiliary subunit